VTFAVIRNVEKGIGMSHAAKSKRRRGDSSHQHRLHR
jgi:hypothetical protein